MSDFRLAVFEISAIDVVLGFVCLKWERLSVCKDLQAKTDVAD